jgi:twitching motility two-component system response regulator PilH
MAKILVVDDVMAERVNVTEILRRRGHSVVEADSGAKAIEMAKHHKPDAIVMDIVMPEMDGFSATKRIAMDPETKGIPIVIVSSKAQESDKFRAKQLGAKGYLVKPVNAENLMGVLSTLL